MSVIWAILTYWLLASAIAGSFWAFVGWRLNVRQECFELEPLPPIIRAKELIL